MEILFLMCFFIFPALLFLLNYGFRYQIKVTILSDLNSEGLTGNVLRSFVKFRVNLTMNISCYSYYLTQEGSV